MYYKKKTVISTPINTVTQNYSIYVLDSQMDTTIVLLSPHAKQTL